MTATKPIEYGVYNNANHDVCIYQAQTEQEAQDFIDDLKNSDNYGIQTCYDDGDFFYIEKAENYDAADIEGDLLVTIDGIDYVAYEWTFCNDK